MALGKATNDYLCDRCQEFAKPHQLVRAEVSEVSIPNLLTAYLPLSDCTCGKRKQRSPNCVPHHVNVESRDLSKLQALRSKRIGRHRVQRSHDAKVELHGDKESLQIYLA
jgi:hypothetical protein